MEIEVRYSCFTCNLTDAKVKVPARASESVTEWMNATVSLLGEDHRRRSPDCVPVDGKLHNLKIPIEDPDKVGGSMRQ